MMGLEKKTAVITGAASGIGRAIALRFASEGARVVAFDIDSAALETLVAEISGSGGAAEARSVDVSLESGVAGAFGGLGGVDILVNNAGISSIGCLEDADPQEFERVYATNVKGVYHCLRLAVPLMAAQKSGVVLNMASIASRLGIQNRFAYSMSKGAVLAMTMSVARDYIGSGIRCNCICPARVHTPFVDTYLDRHYADNRDEMMAELSRFQPIGRMGTPEEIAGLAAFLCSDEAAFITGAAYDIDGGVTSLR